MNKVPEYKNFFSNPGNQPQCAVLLYGKNAFECSSTWGVTEEGVLFPKRIPKGFGKWTPERKSEWSSAFYQLCSVYEKMREVVFLKTREKERLESQTCPHCLRYFATKGKIAKHLLHERSKLSAPNIECCGLSFHPYLFRDHCKVHHLLETTRPCSQCDDSFYSFRDLLVHSLVVHAKDIENSCHLCNYASKQTSKTDAHIRKAHLGLTYCRMCKIWTRSPVCQHEYPTTEFRSFVTDAALENLRHQVKHGEELSAATDETDAIQDLIGGDKVWKVPNRHCVLGQPSDQLMANHWAKMHNEIDLVSAPRPTKRKRC